MANHYCMSELKEGCSSTLMHPSLTIPLHWAIPINYWWCKAQQLSPMMVELHSLPSQISREGPLVPWSNSSVISLNNHGFVHMREIQNLPNYKPLQTHVWHVIMLTYFQITEFFQEQLLTTKHKQRETPMFLTRTRYQPTTISHWVKSEHFTEKTLAKIYNR